jgi:uncharacterized protein (TIGR00255 family)
MLWSMTGFGKSEVIYENKKFSIEIKSLNSKQLDLATRMPYAYNEKELEIRDHINNRLERGKVSFNMFSEMQGANSQYKINKELAAAYFSELQDIASMIGQEEKSDYLQTLMKLPDVVGQSREMLDENEWFAVEKAVLQAIEQLENFRKQEGAVLEADFVKRIQKILELLKEVEKHESARVERIKERILKELNSLAEDIKVDRNRFEQEMIFYIEKLDIAEEKLRLAQHCDYFMKTLKDKGMSKGKKLGFILQEIGREINTLGSKANDTEIQMIVVQMKDELEKIKEQSLNIL